MRSFSINLSMAKERDATQDFETVEQSSDMSSAYSSSDDHDYAQRTRREFPLKDVGDFI